MNYLITLFLLMLFITAKAQDKADLPKNGIFDLEISYGPQYNFFVDYRRDVIVENGYILPYEDFPGESVFNQKRAVGTYFNVSTSIRLGGRNFLELGHSRTLNRGTYNMEFLFPNGTSVDVDDIQLSHRNLFYNLAYKRSFGENDRLQISLGIAYATFQQSELTVWPSAGFVEIEERNHKNRGLSEGMATLGFQYNFYRSGNFELGVKTKMYFIISAGQEPETWSVAPTLKYHF